jgi:hypothetical protein
MDVMGKNLKAGRKREWKRQTPSNHSRLNFKVEVK